MSRTPTDIPMANEPADRLEPADLDGLVERLLACSDEYLTRPDGEWMSGAYPTIYDRAVTAIRSLQARCAELEAWIADFLPTNINLETSTIPESTIIPLDVTIGELRRARTLTGGTNGQ